jgi:proteasome lid subunit RPN8/RPN11
MISRSSQRLQETMLKQKQDRIEMEKIHNLAPSVFLLLAEDGGSIAPDSYNFEVRIRSYIKTTRQGTPIINDRFKLEIKLPKGYSNRKRPKCKVYPAPFHPHFKRCNSLLRGSSYGVWVDPQNYEENLGILVLRITRSLQFDPKFIDIHSSRIGNKEALKWYSQWLSFFNNNLNVLFPSDSTTLPEVFPQELVLIESSRSKTLSAGPRAQKGNWPTTTQPSEKMFQIIDSTPPYQPIIAALPHFQKYYPSDFRGFQTTYQIYIKPKAEAAIFKHISWGKFSPINAVEQGGILLGYVYKDKVTGITFGVAEDAIAGDSTLGTSTYLEMNHTTWKKMIDRVDSMQESILGGGMQIIGWYHTHPNQLDVFMSGTDTNTQMLFFINDWQFAIVLNPQKKIWRAFHGKNAEECRGFIIAHGWNFCLKKSGEQ